MVLLTALLHQLKARFGEPVDVIASGPWSQPLLANQSCVGTVVIIHSRRTPYWLSGTKQALVRWLRTRGAGPAWFCDSFQGVELLKLGGIPDDHICDSRDMPWIRGEHFVERWIRFAEQTPPALAGSLPEVPRPSRRAAVLEIEARARTALEGWLAGRGLAGRPLTLIQAGNKRTTRLGLRKRGSNKKYWPEARWAEVLRAVRAERPEHAILLLGQPAESGLNADIARIAGAVDVHNVADDLPISRLLPLLERAESLISVDTGPAHAAAALGCPTVALFGTADPVLYRPGGVDTPAIAVTGEVDGERSMMGISVQAVLDAWRGLVPTT
jgi:heptosyltransferase-2/heptosyltransferase-3